MNKRIVKELVWSFVSVMIALFGAYFLSNKMTFYGTINFLFIFFMILMISLAGRFLKDGWRDALGLLAGELFWVVFLAVIFVNFIVYKLSTTPASW